MRHIINIILGSVGVPLPPLEPGLLPPHPPPLLLHEVVLVQQPLAVRDCTLSVVLSTGKIDSVFLSSPASSLDIIDVLRILREHTCSQWVFSGIA